MHLIKTSILVLAAALIAGCGRNHEVNPSGTLETTEVDIASTIAGRIREVRPQLGDRVNAGDTLVVLDTDLIALQREQAATNRESLRAQRLAAGDALAQAQSNLDLADTTFARTQALVKAGSATSQQHDEAQTRRDVTARQVLAAKHQLEALAAEESKLDASLAVFDRQLHDGVILAPENGEIILRNAEPGETALPGSVLLRLANLKELELRIYLAEQDLSRVRLGQELPVLVDALAGQTLTGKVTWISSDAEFTPKNVQTRQARTQLVYAVKLSIANPEGKLHIGMPAEAKL
jgi:HlyD family secretion protein